MKIKDSCTHRFIVMKKKKNTENTLPVKILEKLDSMISTNQGLSIIDWLSK
jgi:hypothetical protein